MTEEDRVEVVARSMGEIQSVLTRKALSEPDFRERSLADSRGTVDAFVGEPLRKSAQIAVQENGAAVLHRVLPPALPQQGKIADEELDAASRRNGFDYGQLGRLIGNFSIRVSASSMTAMTLIAAKGTNY